MNLEEQLKQMTENCNKWKNNAIKLEDALSMCMQCIPNWGDCDPAINYALESINDFENNITNLP